jgi:hypothetical protein
MLYKEEGKGGGHVQMEFGIKNGVAVDWKVEVVA